MGNWNINEVMTLRGSAEGLWLFFFPTPFQFDTEAGNKGIQITESV